MANSPKTYAFLPPDIDPNLRQVLMRMMNDIQGMRPAAVASTPASDSAQTITVDPIYADRVKIVGSVYGDINGKPLVTYFSTIQSAIDACAAPTATNQFVVYILPGLYTENLTCKDYVHLVANGGVTVACSEDKAITCANNSLIGINFVHTVSTSTVSTTITAIASCSISKDMPTNNYHNTNYGGDAGTLWADTPSLTHAQAALFTLDTSSIPAGATITAATLHLNQTYRHYAGADNNLYGKALLIPYVDSQATWNVYSTGNNWNTAGANGSGTDTNASQRTLANLSGYPSGTGWRTMTGTGVVSLANDMLVGYGIKLYTSGGTAGDNAFEFTAEGYANEPYMDITYSGKPVSSCLYVSGVVTNIFGCTISGDAASTQALKVTSGGTINSQVNKFSTCLTDFVNSASSLYTAGDYYTTSSGTITPRGNADMLDGYHATYFEPAITAGTTAQYWRGDKSWQNLATDARAAISSTVTGLTYTTVTGVLSLTSGYVIPTTTDQSTWNSALQPNVTANGTWSVYNDGITSGQVTGFTVLNGLVTQVTVIP